MRAILAKTTTDLHKSRIKSSQLAELVLECYIKPKEFANLIENFDASEFEFEILSFNGKTKRGNKKTIKV